VAIGSDGRFLVSGSADKTVKVWNLDTGVPLHTFEHSDWIRSVAVDPDGRLVAGGEDGGLKVWDSKTGEPVRAVVGHSRSALSVDVSPDGQLLVSGGSDGKIKAWDLRTGEPLNILSGHPEGVGCVAVSPDGLLLASGGYDHAIKIWEKVPNLREERPADLSPDSPRLYSPREGDAAPGRPQDLPD
jgi:WD40 repeat protein